MRNLDQQHLIPMHSKSTTTEQPTCAQCPDLSRWNGQRYFPISRYYQDKYGAKTYKVSVSVASTCPNRKGNNGMETCIFCDEYGSAAYHLEHGAPLAEQIKRNTAKIAKRYRAEHFLVYFQSYTNTFARVETLRSLLKTAAKHEGVVGLVLGTRPDCLPKNMLRMLAEVSQQTSVQIELGLQTFNEEHLLFLKRGHTSLCGIEAIHKLKAQTNAHVGIHLIFGIPGETLEHLGETARLINSLPIDSVKVHNLHVLKGTGLEPLYAKGQFTPISLEEYSRRVIYFLEYLSPKVAVHRLAATASRHDQLVAPAWTKERMRPVQYILDQMAAQNTWQGRWYT